MAEYAHLVTARRSHRCEDYPGGGSECQHLIQPGSDYVRAVAFPDDVTDHIWVLRLCVPCATRYGKPLPPRRTKGGPR
jgi:hypothetical protein